VRVVSTVTLPNAALQVMDHTKQRIRETPDAAVAVRT
jgi:hypothetical protein